MSVGHRFESDVFTSRARQPSLLDRALNNRRHGQDMIMIKIEILGIPNLPGPCRANTLHTSLHPSPRFLALSPLHVLQVEVLARAHVQSLEPL